MQKLAAAFSSEGIKSIHDNYSNFVFCEAMRHLIENGLLTDGEKTVIVKITDGIKNARGFLSKSCFIYFSNGILLEKDPERIKKIKNQMIFELAISFLDRGMDKKISYANDDTKLFSLCLNRNVNAKFNSIEKDGKEYIFRDDGKEVLRLGKNPDCSITESVDFLEKDLNPFNAYGDHPDEEFVAYDLSGIPREGWVRQFRNAYSLIKEQVPEIYDEIYCFLDAVVPHGYSPGKQLSSSYSKSPGILYLSYTDEDTEQAEAIIHEVHHTIFNIISWKYNILNNDESLKYYSAYRPDARHIRGCFIGLHAFVAVQNFYRKLAEKSSSRAFMEKFLDAYIRNGKVIAVLERYADFTKEGNLLFRDIKGKYDNDSGFFMQLKQKEPELCKKMSDKAESHLEEAKKRNKVLLY